MLLAVMVMAQPSSDLLFAMLSADVATPRHQRERIAKKVESPLGVNPAAPAVAEAFPDHM